MPKKTFTPEQIVPKLRQIEVLIGQGKAVPLACKEAGITAQTFYRWRKEYGGLQLEQKKLKDLQKENAQLRRAVADLTVEKQIDLPRLFQPVITEDFRTAANSLGVR
jgi:putative transposase